MSQSKFINLKFNKKGDIEIDELVKIILFGILMLVLIFIVGYLVSGEFSNQEENIKGVFGILR